MYDDKGWPDLLSKRWVEYDGRWMITCMSLKTLRLNPDANATALNPYGYSQRHTLAHVAADHEAVVCNLLIPNGTTDHTQLIVAIHTRSIRIGVGVFSRCT